jgi:hypothetical protein
MEQTRNKFPENREINREFFKFSPAAGPFAVVEATI